MTLLKTVKEEKHRFETLKALNFNPDPWESYIYMDSKWYMKILHNTQFVDIDEMIIRIQFLIQVVENDVTGYFQDNAENLVKEFIEFVKGDEMWTEAKESNGIEKAKDFFKFNLESNQVVELEETINYLFEKFYQNLKMEDRLLEFKNDYL